MATITTTTVTDNLAPPGNAPFVLQPSTGYLFAAFRSATDTLAVWRSIDSGATWATYASFTHVGLAEWSSLVADTSAGSYLHIAYRVSTTGGGGTDAIYYRRLNTATAGWSGSTEATIDSNGGTAGAIWQGLDIAVVRNSNGSYAIAIAAAQAYPGVKYGITVHGMSITTGGTIYSNDGIISGTRYWYVNGTPPGRVGVQCEIEHTGDGFTPNNSAPHVWISWGRTGLYMVKLAWQGSASGWQGPTNAITIRSSVSVNADYAAARWDGNRWVMAIASPDDSTKVRLYQRDRANTTTTTLDTPAHTTGVIRYCSMSYDRSTGNPRVYAIGTSTAVLYYVDYNRVAGTWASWSTVVAAAVSNTGNEWGVRKGGNSNNVRHDVVTASGASSPFTLTHTAQSITSPPAIPSLLTALNSSTGVAYINGGAADVGVGIQFNWTFSDTDPGDTQGSYALSRQTGAAAAVYWNATSSTWVASEVQNTGVNPTLSFAAAWGLDADAVYSYRVKVWDAAGNPSPGYSPVLQLTPSTKVNPVVVTPAAAAVITTDTLNVTWTAAQQTAYRVAMSNTGTGVLVWDTGKVNSTDLAYTVPYVMPNGTAYQVTLYTWNNESLISAAQSRNFTVAYSPPAAAISVVTPVPSSGVMNVASSVLAPVGAQPAIVSMDLYRRTAITPVLNANPTFAGNVTGWFIGGGGTPGTLTYSTTQAHEAPGSARYVPNAAGAAAPQVESSGFQPVTAGQVYYGSAWIRPDTASKPIRVYLNLYNVSSTFITSVFYEITTPIAAAWHFLETFVDPVSLAPTCTQIRVAVGEASTPVAVDAFYADEIKLELYNSDMGVRIATQKTSPAIVNDFGAVHGVDSEYRWGPIRGANGTTIYGPWS